jgi:hypothetical protein
MGLLLYKGAFTQLAYVSIDNMVYAGFLLLILLPITSPRFFSLARIRNGIKKILNEKLAGLVTASIIMSVFVFVNMANLDTKTIFVAALLSACAGFCITQAGVLSKFWRLRVRPNMN